ncbi:LptF/LptG family permease [Limoniibacter endophyticus]|uniref:LPS export ABC transporter permease LptF n=1 Tax=Limoniibacter endophyticus TaxID=1565040 RepID=A0A8J3GH26_9HYPH|nr:LptF/LptG family permease [Limoniibacter endophyticus]GHC68758.1 LPS export ABC transporter permease LptF [Limoniibacter endophyticus]
MNIIERYVLRRAFIAFSAALAGTLAIVWVTQALSRIDIVTDSRQSAGTFLEIATLILPSVVPEVIPFAIAIALGTTLFGLNSDSELVVVNAAGASRWILLKPILILAILASALSFVFDNAIDPLARERFRNLLADARADLISQVIQEGSFQRLDDKLFIQVGQRLPDGRLGQIFVADSREAGTELVYYAKEGVVAEFGAMKALLMRDGVVHRKQENGDISVINFESYAFDLSALMPARNEPIFFAKDRSLSFLANPDTNDAVYQRSPQEFHAEFHRRLTDWLYPIVFALIAFGVAGDARSHREARIHPLVTIVAICMFVRWLGFFVGNRADSSAAWTPFIYLVPFGYIAFVSVFIYKNKPLELPLSVAEYMMGTVRAFNDRLILLRHRLLGHKRPETGSEG